MVVLNRLRRLVSPYQGTQLVHVFRNAHQLFFPPPVADGIALATYTPNPAGTLPASSSASCELLQQQFQQVDQVLTEHQNRPPAADQGPLSRLRRGSPKSRSWHGLGQIISITTTPRAQPPPLKTIDTHLPQRLTSHHRHRGAALPVHDSAARWL